jgi:hypothetical protein
MPIESTCLSAMPGGFFGLMVLRLADKSTDFAFLFLSATKPPYRRNLQAYGAKKLCREYHAHCAVAHLLSQPVRCHRPA